MSHNFKVNLNYMLRFQATYHNVCALWEIMKQWAAKQLDFVPDNWNSLKDVWICRIQLNGWECKHDFHWLWIALTQAVLYKLRICDILIMIQVWNVKDAWILLCYFEVYDEYKCLMKCGGWKWLVTYWVTDQRLRSRFFIFELYWWKLNHIIYIII